MIDYRLWHPICLAIILGMLGISAYCLILLAPYDDAWSGEAVTFMTGDAIAMALCLILFASIYMDKKIGLDMLFFMCLLSLEFILLLTEFQRMYVETYDPSSQVVWISYLIGNSLFPVLIWVFGNYEKTAMDVTKEQYRPYGILLNILLIIITAMNVGQALTGWLFSVEDGVYTVTEYDNYQNALIVLLCFVCLALAIRFGTTITQRLVTLLYLAVPLILLYTQLPYYNPSLMYLTNILMFIFIYSGIYMSRGITIAKNKAAMTERKINLMITRIEPRYLNEALISIESIEGNPEETRRAIAMFRKYLSENVSTISQVMPIPFKAELDHVRIYTDLEKLRFKEKVNVIYDIRADQFKLPSMTVQMMVENAIKHGITQREEGGTVTVTSEELEDAFRITVSDDGVGFDVNTPRDTSRSHIGLDNLEARLKNVVNGTFEITSTPGKGTVAVVTIPKKAKKSRS